MIYSHPDIAANCVDKPLIEVEEKHGLQQVFATSEIELKERYPGVWGIRRVKPGCWKGIIFLD